MKKFIVPLQAFAALLFCAGMAWMVFVLASINPTPPSATDLQARNTQDLSFADMNSTAVALAQEMVANLVPTASGRIFLPVTGRETATASPTIAITLKPIFTSGNTPTPSSDLSNVYQSTPTRKKKEEPDDPPTLVPTSTPQPPTATSTIAASKTNPPTVIPVTPTQTGEPPTVAPTATVEPTNPPTAEPTAIEPPPTATTEPIVGTTETPAQASP